MKLLMTLTLALTSAVALAQSSSGTVKGSPASKSSHPRKVRLKPAKAATTTAPAKATTAPTAAPAAAAPAATTTGTTDSPTMAILKDHLQIRYFSELLGPSIYRWDDNQVDVDAKGNYSRSTAPVNLFNQFSFRWRIVDQWRVALEPRFTTQFGDRNDLDPKSEDTQVIVQEDHRIRLFNGQLYASKDGTFSLMGSIGNRFPTSKASKGANIIAQPELMFIPSWQPTPSFNFSVYHTLRYYYFEQKVDRERYRIYTSPNITYTLNDIYSLYLQYEHELQHNQPEGKRKYNYTVETLQDVYAGVNINVTPSLTIMPFLRFPSMRKFEQDTTQLGAWFMGVVF